MEVEQLLQVEFSKGEVPEESSEVRSMAVHGDPGSNASVVTSRGDNVPLGVVGMPNGDGRIRKKHRRGSKKNKPRKKRDWKPYDKLTWDEKRQLEAEDAVKAIKKRQELVIQKGRPIAPYNTTQFLMEEHDPGDENVQADQRPAVEKQLSIDRCSENDVSDSSSSSDEYFEKDFDEAYYAAHMEQLHSMSKEELVKSIMELEQKLEGTVESRRKNELLVRTNFELTLDNSRLREENFKLNEQINLLRQGSLS